MVQKDDPEVTHVKLSKNKGTISFNDTHKRRGSMKIEPEVTLVPALDRLWYFQGQLCPGKAFPN